MIRPDYESTDWSTLRGLWYELRPHQWYKQAVLFIPLVYSGQALDPTGWGRITAGALVFSLAAGCVYIVNDLLDREEDQPIRSSSTDR
jgi:4-hydroxybenzoate polyprenyltransferase